MDYTRERFDLYSTRKVTNSDSKQGIEKRGVTTQLCKRENFDLPLTS